MKKFKNSNTGKRPTCSFCGIDDHSVDKCYKKHGYPPGYKFTNRKVNHSVNQVETGFEQCNSNFEQDKKGKQVMKEKAHITEIYGLTLTKE